MKSRLSTECNGKLHWITLRCHASVYRESQVDIMYTIGSITCCLPDVWNRVGNSVRGSVPANEMPVKGKSKGASEFGDQHGAPSNFLHLVDRGGSPWGTATL